MVIQSLLHWLFIFNQLLLRKRMLFYRISEGGVFMVVNSLVETSCIYCDGCLQYVGGTLYKVPLYICSCLSFWISLSS